MRLWRAIQTEHSLEGHIRVGSSTKQLLQGIEPRHVIVIRHRDLDDMAAADIIDAKVKAVINAEQTMSGDYPIAGGRMLLDAGIPIFEIDPDQFKWFQDGMYIRIKAEHDVAQDGHRERYTLQLSALALNLPAIRFSEKYWSKKNAQAQMNLSKRLSEFVDNTLDYAAKEKEFITKNLEIPPLATKMSGKHVVVVVRGNGYKRDLQAIRDYIEDYRPVLIGVDGGADALLEFGFTPHLIIGDMDSISDEALRCGAEILVHAYCDGRAPGMQRVNRLGLAAKQIPAPGTSEDVAMLIAYENNAAMIVTLGAHSHMIDFLQKGRKGMASTLLVRMKIGSKLVDAKGVSTLYHRPFKLRNLWVVPAAGVFPLAMLGLIHPGFRHVMDMLWLYLKLSISQ